MVLRLWWLGLVGCTNEPARETIRVAIGTQDSTINCATGGLLVRELDLLAKHLPHDGRYANVDYEIVWKNFTSGPPLTGEMVADKLDFGNMADFPSALNGVAHQEQGKRSVYIATLSGSTTGAGNGLVVPLDSPAKSLADLKGKQISVPFGSAAHGMLLRAIADLGWNAETDVTLVSQSPEIGGSSLQAHKIDAHADFVPFAELFPFRGYARKIYDGSQVGIPTSHGALVRGEYADQYPEIVVAYLEAVLEADALFASDPEKYSELVEKVSGVEAEVDYMFHGPLGLQTRDYTLKPEFREGLAVAVKTLRLLGRTDKELDVDTFVDDRFIREAAENAGLDYDARLASYEKVPLTGNDARTGEPITDPTRAAQVWVEGEPKVRAYATPGSALQDVATLGNRVRAAWVHDRKTGSKLFARAAWYTQGDDGISAFLLQSDALAWAAEHGGTPVDYAVLAGPVTPDGKR